MNDAVDRLIVEREAMDRGFPGTLAVSALGHAFLVGAALVAPFLFPGEPPIRVVVGPMIALPRGGGGTPTLEPPAPATVQPQAPPEPAPQPKVQPPPKIAKPPKDEPKRGLPEPNAKKVGKPQKSPPPRAALAGGTPGGTATSTRTQGLSIGPPGPGVPDGVDSGGDWYLAGVQQKIWLIWTQQIKSGFTQPIAVTFTILADGSLEDVSVSQPSGATLLELAAKRAVYSAAPFGPLPKHYGTNRLTIQAIFKPAP